tara:strand:+ start:133 stop:585 length:453 start_codon:yes stop_codon:yes gene_type:complete
MSAQRYWYRNGDVRDAEGMPMLGHNELAHDESQIRSPMVMRDIPEYQSPIDDRWITSRSWRREDLRRNDCIEADPPKRKRGVTNARFAKKRGLALCEETIEATRHRKERREARMQKKLDAEWSLNGRVLHDARQAYAASQPKRRRRRGTA